MPHTLSTRAPITTYYFFSDWNPDATTANKMVLKLSNDNEEGMYVSFVINNWQGFEWNLCISISQNKCCNMWSFENKINVFVSNGWLMLQFCVVGLIETWIEIIHRYHTNTQKKFSNKFRYFFNADLVDKWCLCLFFILRQNKIMDKLN